MKTTFQRKDCPWKYIGDYGVENIYWCENCGALSSKSIPQLVENPARVDLDTYLCPDQLNEQGM
jgi:hypothetical protein